MLPLAQETTDDNRYRVAATRLCAHRKDTSCHAWDAVIDGERREREEREKNNVLDNRNNKIMNNINAI